MKIDYNNISNTQVKFFYESYWEHRTIINDFYKLLPEDKYDFHLINNEDTKSDTPRESLAHIIEIQLVYLNGIESGKLVFKSMKVNHYYKMNKQELLDEMDRVENKMFEYLNNTNFNPDAKVHAPWGENSAISTLWAMKDHYILHEGWNLAIMDAIGMKRFDSLKNLWG